MKYLFILFLGVSLLFSSCYCECCACEGTAGEIDLTVLDMDNKPISGVPVGPYVYPNGNNTYNFFKQTYQTDAKGQVHANYVFPPDSYTNWTLAVADFNDYKAVNYIESPYAYTPSKKKVTTIDTIRMDSLKTIKLRFKTNKTNVEGLFLRVYSGNSTPKTKISRDFYSNATALTTTSSFDTSIEVRAFAKAEIWIDTRLRLKNTPLDIYQTKKLDNYARRDTVFLFEF